LYHGINITLQIICNSHNKSVILDGSGLLFFNHGCHGLLNNISLTPSINYYNNTVIHLNRTISSSSTIKSYFSPNYIKLLIIILGLSCITPVIYQETKKPKHTEINNINVSEPLLTKTTYPMPLIFLHQSTRETSTQTIQLYDIPKPLTPDSTTYVQMGPNINNHGSNLYLLKFFPSLPTIKEDLNYENVHPHPKP